MELTNKGEIKELLKKYNARPEKYLGQHFLLSKTALRKTIEAAEIKPNDLIIEIGPGLGTLTLELAKTNAKVIAVEKDRLMNEILKEVLAGFKNVKIIQADVRQLLILRINSFGEKMGITIGKSGYKIVANLPYNIATFLIRSFLESDNPPKMMVLMIQKEVAWRIVAKPPHSSILAISVQFYADAKIIGYVTKESFYPRPKVDAAIIKIVPRENPYSVSRKEFFKTLKAGFSSPRKQLIGNFSKRLNLSREKLVEIFQNLNILSTARAENISLDDWQKLVYKLIHN
ncbi:MAG: 16S rRNA (adenine(1518)-N(6)/adenine(1519)-N(6))-dimethyltransferase RsmA [Candidatus Azambacteria bacterium]|nr:16S rRNA (adenine(1518)-N(6)/adenine(1519)-N(6))-dimethyltransferase RsmA [Candidatus Azambacteria bacterium]